MGQISCTGQDIYYGTGWTLDIECKTKSHWDNAAWRQIQRGNLIAVRQARQPHGAPKTLEVDTDNCAPVRWERRSKTDVWARNYTLTDELLFVEAGGGIGGFSQVLEPIGAPCVYYVDVSIQAAKASAFLNETGHPAGSRGSIHLSQSYGLD